MGMYERFVEFYNNHPEVYVKLREMALGLKRRGHTKWGIRNLWEVLRWQHSMSYDGKYKLPDHFPAFYARMLMLHEPELRGFFSVKHSAIAERHIPQPGTTIHMPPPPDGVHQL